MNSHHLLTISIIDLWDGVTIEQLLRDIFSLPKKPLHELRMSKELLRNGEAATFRTTIAAGDDVSFPFLAEKTTDYALDHTPLNILYEDDHVLLVDKPSGVDTHPNDVSQNGTLTNRVEGYLAQRNKQEDALFVHRLDRDTSGAILFAKHKFIHRMLDQQLVNRGIKRTYAALVHGKWPFSQLTISDAIGEDRHHGVRRRVSPRGQAAVTHVRLVQQSSSYSLVSCQLETGRTHQIRVHLSHRGHPIVGDTLYGGKALLPYQALHARELTFSHPFIGKTIRVEAPVPTEWSPFIEALK